MPKSISIGGVPFEVSTPYSAGHVLTEAEAKSLNQTRAENIGNNFRSAVKEALAKPEGAEREAALNQVIADLKSYDAEYNFTVTQARTPVDPIEAEAIRIAKDIVKANIAEKLGKTVKAYLEIAGNQAKYDANVEKVAVNPEVLKEAKKRVAAKKKTIDLGSTELELA